MSVLVARVRSYDRESVWRMATFTLAWLAFAWAVLNLRMILIHPNAQFDGVSLWRAWHGPMYIDLEAGPSLWWACYHWSPLAALFLWPGAQLPDVVFVGLWAVAGSAVYAWLLAPLPLASRIPAMGAGILFSLNGNIEWLLALICVIGMRWPALWLVGLFTKVTPFVGFGYFILKRDWNAVAWTAVIAVIGIAISVVILPSQWLDWLRLLPTLGGESARTGTYNSLMPPIPLIVRGPIAVFLVWWSARRNQPAWLAVMLLLAQPDMQPWALGYLAAIPRMIAAPGSDAAAKPAPEPAQVAP